MAVEFMTYPSEPSLVCVATRTHLCCWISRAASEPSLVCVATRTDP